MKKRGRIAKKQEYFYVLEDLEKICTTMDEVESLIGDNDTYATFCRKEDATSYLINVIRQRIGKEFQTN